LAVSIYDIEELVNSEVDEYSLVNQLFIFTEEKDYFVKHRSYYLLMKIASEFSMEHILKFNNFNDVLEEDVLRMLDISTKLKRDSPLGLKRLLYSPNPYLVRGEVVALAKNGSVKSLEVLLEFAISTKGRIIRRELFAELFGYMIDKEPSLRKYIDERKYASQNIRGYLRDMKLNGPKYNRISVFPSNDYWALKVRALNLDYSDFKKIVEGQIFRKNVKSL